MVTEAENAPEEFAAMFVGVVVNGKVSNFIVMLVFGVKPTPLTVTVEPAFPDVGESVMAVAKTVNVADFVFVLSVADTV